MVQEHRGNLGRFEGREVRFKQHAGEHHAVHLARGEVADVPALLGEVAVRVGQQQGVAELGRGVLDGMGQQREEGVGVVRDDQADGLAGAQLQRAGGGIGPVAQDPDGILHLRLGGRGHFFRAAVDDIADDGGAHAGVAGDVLAGHRAAGGVHCRSRHGFHASHRADRSRGASRDEHFRQCPMAIYTSQRLLAGTRLSPKQQEKFLASLESTRVDSVPAVTHITPPGRVNDDYHHQTSGSRGWRIQAPAPREDPPRSGRGRRLGRPPDRPAVHPPGHDRLRRLLSWSRRSAASTSASPSTASWEIPPGSAPGTTPRSSPTSCSGTPWPSPSSTSA